jgi:hypothetical protein
MSQLQDITMKNAFFEIYGHKVLCRILARHAAGTYDVERLSDGRCFRVSGLPG